jgi:hypothetical protein
MGVQRAIPIPIAHDTAARPYHRNAHWELGRRGRASPARAVSVRDPFAALQQPAPAARDHSSVAVGAALDQLHGRCGLSSSVRLSHGSPELPSSVPERFPAAGRIPHFISERSSSLAGGAHDLGGSLLLALSMKLCLARLPGWWVRPSSIR